MRKFSLMLLSMLVALPVVAAVGDDISYTYEGQTLTYTILDEDAKTVEVKAGKNNKPGEGNVTDDDYNPGNTVVGALIIPDKIESNGTEYTVTAIGERAFYMNSGLTSVNIQASVPTIPLSAFYRCTSLTSVEIPNSVTSIGNSAFYNCTSLTEFTIPASVTEIGAYTFAHCTGLTTLTSLCVVAPTSNDAFEGLYDQVSLIVPQNGVDSYIYSEGEWSSFTNISTLEGKKYNVITDSNGLRYRVVSDNSAMLIIGNYTDMTEANILGTLEAGGNAYSVTSISSDVFKKCSKLTSVTIPETVTSIGRYAFNECTALESVTIPESVTSLGSFAFMRCEKLKSVTSLGSITSIGNNTFARYALTSVTIPTTVTSIGGSAFSLCYALKSVEIPASVTSIATAGFSDCTGLTSVTFLGSATNIEIAAFKGSINLTNIILKSANPPSLEYGAFSSSDPYEYFYLYKNATVTVPDGCLGNYLSSDWASFSNIKTESGDTPGESFTNEGLNYKVVGQNSVMLGGGDFSGMTTVTIPEEVVEDGKTYHVTTIGKEALYGSKIISVVLPSSVTFIGESAFCDCSNLTSVTIPSTVTGIGNYAFNGCSSLTSITIPASVTYIGTGVFEDCTDLRLLDMSGVTLSDFSIVADKVPENTLIYVKEGTSGTAGRANVVVGEQCENFVINYGKTTNNQLLLSVPHAFTANQVTINRSFTEGNPATLYLPFELVADNYGIFYTGGTYDAAKETVYFSEVKEILTTPNTPYMFIPKQNLSSITLENVGVCVTPEDVDKDGFNGVYKKKEFTEKEVASKQYYGWAGGKFCWADTGAMIDACRAYFKLPASAAASAPASLKASFGSHDTSGITDVTIDEEGADEPVYNVYGQRVGSDYRGVVIKNGRKIINRAR